MRLLTLARDLTRRKARDRSGLFVAEGIRLVEELLASGLHVTGALACDLIDRTPRGAALVVVDPRRAGPASRADQWLRVRPGTDGALALGLIARQPGRGGAGGLGVHDDVEVGLGQAAIEGGQQGPGLDPISEDVSMHVVSPGVVARAAPTRPSE